jgi:hypothetical protein
VSHVAVTPNSEAGGNAEIATPIRLAEGICSGLPACSRCGADWVECFAYCNHAIFVTAPRDAIGMDEAKAPIHRPGAARDYAGSRERRCTSIRLAVLYFTSQILIERGLGPLHAYPAIQLLRTGRNDANQDRCRRRTHLAHRLGQSPRRRSLARPRPR